MFYVLVQRVKGQEQQGKYDNNNNNKQFFPLISYIPTVFIRTDLFFTFLSVLTNRQKV